MECSDVTNALPNVYKRAWGECFDVTSALPDVYKRAWESVLTLLAHCLMFIRGPGGEF